MNTETARRWLEAKRTKKQLDSALRDVSEEIQNLEISLIDQMINDGITQVKLDGATIYQSNVKRADVAYQENESTDEGYNRTCDELERVGLGHLVKRRFFTQSVASWLAHGGDQALIEDFMNVQSIPKLGVRGLG